MKRMLCLEDAISVIIEKDVVYKDRFYYVSGLEKLTHNDVCVYEVYDESSLYYIGIFRADNFISLAEYRNKQIDEVLDGEFG